MAWNFDKNKPIYIQLVEMITFKIVSGEFLPGAKLDSVREMAQEADVNPNTMQRALTELEREGIVFSQRTSGRFVTDDKDLIKRTREKIARTEVARLKERLTFIGYNDKEVKEIINNIMEE